MNPFLPWTMNLPLSVVSRPPVAIGKCPLTGVEVKVRDDRFVADAGVQKQVLKIGAYPLQPQETSASAVIGQCDRALARNALR
jgi:hypothetical protein